MGNKRKRRNQGTDNVLLITAIITLLSAIITLATVIIDKAR